MSVTNLLPLILVVLSLPFADRQIFIGPIPFYPPELFVTYALVMFLWQKRYRDTSATTKAAHRFILPISFLLSGLILSIIFSDHLRTGLGILKAWFLFPILFAWLVVRSIRSIKELTIILWAWYTLTLSLALIGWQYILDGSFTYDGRLQAAFASPNFLAMMLLPGVFLGFFFLKNVASSHRMHFFLLAFSWTLILTAFYSAFSYAAWIGGLIGLGVTQYLNSPRRNIHSLFLIVLMLLIALLVLVSLQLPTEKFQNLLHGYERSSLASRLMIWRSAAHMLVNHPLVGIGPGNFQTVYLEYQRFFPPYLEWAVPQPHNLYLAFWLQTGIIGLIGFLWLIVSWLRILFTSLRIKEKTPLCATLIGIMTAILFQGLLDTPYWKTDLAYTFWLLFALGQIASSRESTSKRKE